MDGDVLPMGRYSGRYCQSPEAPALSAHQCDNRPHSNTARGTDANRIEPGCQTGVVKQNLHHAKEGGATIRLSLKYTCPGVDPNPLPRKLTADPTCP